jgi:hypothetical protein
MHRNRRFFSTYRDHGNAEGFGIIPAGKTATPHLHALPHLRYGRHIRASHFPGPGGPAGVTLSSADDEECSVIAGWIADLEVRNA